MGVAGDSKERACWVHEDAAHGIIGRAEVAHRCSRAAIVQFWDGEAERRRRMLYVHMLILADQMSSGVPGREEGGVPAVLAKVPMRRRPPLASSAQQRTRSLKRAWRIVAPVDVETIETTRSCKVTVASALDEMGTTLPGREVGDYPRQHALRMTRGLCAARVAASIAGAQTCCMGQRAFARASHLSPAQSLRQRPSSTHPPKRPPCPQKHPGAARESLRREAHLESQGQPNESKTT
eukprot:scaffold13882_cov31-Tisochrysis_lutea.AAC.3